MSIGLEPLEATSTTVDLLKMLLEAILSSSKAVDTIFDGINKGNKDDVDYEVQEKVLKDFISHVDKGGKLEHVEVISKDQSAIMLNILKSEGIPFVANETENGMLFVFKDVDHGRFMDVAKEAESLAKNKGHEMNYEEFSEKVARNKDFYKVEGLSQEEIAVFRREATKESDPFVFAVREGTNGTFEILADNKKALDKTVTDTLFTMGTTQGQAYAKELAPFDKMRDECVNLAYKMSKGNTPAYIIDASNPTKIIELNEGQYRKHGFGIAKDSEGKEHVIDVPSRYSKAISHDIYDDMNLMKMQQPILISGAEASKFIKGISRNGEIELAARYADSKEKLVGLAVTLQEEYLPNSTQMPIHEPQVENVASLSHDFKEKSANMTVYQSIPLAVLLKVEKANIEGVYTYNKGNMREIACTPEASAQLNAILKENLAQDKGPLDTWLTMEKYKGHGERSENKDETYYIVDAALPDAILEISPQDVTYKDAETSMVITAPEGMSMDVAILAQVQKMSAPMILSKDEYEIMSESFVNRQQMIESHYTNPQLSNVIQTEQQKLDSERDILYDLIENPKAQQQMKKDMTPAQQYVIKQRGKRTLDAKHQDKTETRSYNPKVQNKEKPKTNEKNFEPDR